MALLPARSPLALLVIPVLPVVSPTRLWLPEISVPLTSGLPALNVLSAAIVFLSVTAGLPLTLMPPPPPPLLPLADWDVADGCLVARNALWIPRSGLTVSSPLRFGRDCCHH